MNKFNQLGKQVAKETAISAGLVGVAIAILLGAGLFASSAEGNKQKADAALSQQRSQLATMKAQLESSGAAEKRYVQVQLNRANSDFTTSVDGLRNWIRDAKMRYRFTNSFKLNLPPLVLSTQPEFSGLNYDIALRSPVKIDLEAMSDLHVLSFIHELSRQAPGVIRLTYLEMERDSDMSNRTYNMMVSGSIPKMVTARLQFMWIGIHPKGSVIVGKPGENGASGEMMGGM